MGELLAAYQAMLEAVFEMSGVSRLQYSVLAALASAVSGASGAWIARQCGISRQAAHRVLRVLEGRHLVDGRSLGPHRSMNDWYVLSDWGTSRVEICSSALDSAQKEVAEQFGAEEIETLCQLMSACARRLRQTAAQVD